MPPFNPVGSVSKSKVQKIQYKETKRLHTCSYSTVVLLDSQCITVPDLALEQKSESKSGHNKIEENRDPHLTDCEEGAVIL